MFWVVLSVSTRLAAVTACTSVVSCGFPLAPVTTGAAAIAATLPGPLAGSWAHPAPTGLLGSAAAALAGAADEEPAAALDRVDDEADEPDDVQAASGSTRPATTARSAPRGTGVGFTGRALYVATTVRVCHPVAPAG